MIWEDPLKAQKIDSGNKILMALLAFALIMFAVMPLSSAALNWTHPQDHEILTSPGFFLNLSSGSAQDCSFNFNGLANQSVNCNGLTFIRLPAVDGTYNLSVFETFPAQIEYNHQITLQVPSGLLVTTYTVIFIGLCFILIFLFLYAFGRLISLDFDLLDLCLNIGTFFALLAYQAMNMQYLGSEFINDWVLWIIDKATWTNIYLPVLAFLLTITLGPLLRAKYPQIFARMPGGKGAGEMPDPSTIGKPAKGA